MHEITRRGAAIGVVLYAIAFPAEAGAAPASKAAATPAAPAASVEAPFIGDDAVQLGVPQFDVAKLGPPVKLCGWWDNPTPQNMSLTDRDGEWTVGVQGSYMAGGDGPDFSSSQQVPRGAPHGHGCACITALVDRPSKYVYSILRAQPLALKVCRTDPKLKGKEPTPR